MSQKEQLAKSVEDACQKLVSSAEDAKMSSACEAIVAISNWIKQESLGDLTQRAGDRNPNTKPVAPASPTQQPTTSNRPQAPRLPQGRSQNSSK